MFCCVDWGCGMPHKTLKGGACLGGRLRAEMLRNMAVYNHVDLSKLVTRVYHGFEYIEEALLLMNYKRNDLNKAVVILE